MRAAMRAWDDAVIPGVPPGSLSRSPIIAQRIDAGKCGIVCATTDPVNGRLRTYATIGPVGEVPDTLLECV